jgi:hypothetical protein
LNVRHTKVGISLARGYEVARVVFKLKLVEPTILAFLRGCYSKVSATVPPWVLF